MAGLARLAAPEVNPAGAVYGTLTAGAVLAAEVGRHETFLDDVLAVVAALLLYWLAHAYADALGGRLEHGDALSLRHLARHLIDSSTFLRGAAVPLLALLVSRGAGATTAQAVFAALVSAAATLLLLEAIAGVRQRSTAQELLLQMAVGAVLGVGLLTIRVVLH